jgi:hypothetical protein
MATQKLTNRARVLGASTAALTALLGFSAVAPSANAAFVNHPAVAAEGTQPVAPNFFEGESNTINIAGSETAEYALELVGALYNNAGIFGCNQNGDKRTCNTSTPILPSTNMFDNYDHNVVNNAQAVGSAAGVTSICSTANTASYPSASGTETDTEPNYPAGGFNYVATAAGTGTTITDSNADWLTTAPNGEWGNAGASLEVGGAYYSITSNTSTTLTVTGPIAPVPTSGEAFTIVAGAPYTATAGTATTITDAAATWTPGEFVDYSVTTSGTGATQYLISSNTATTITVNGAGFSVVPGAGTTFEVQNEDWPYYTYPIPGGTTSTNFTDNADGIPIDLVRASASEFDLSNHGVTVCSDLDQQGVAQDAVVGVTYRPQGTTAGQLPDSTPVEEVAPAAGLDFSIGAGPGTASDTAWRVFCDTSNTDGLSITTWDQLYAAEGIGGAPSPDQPIVLWGPKNNSGTGATWYTYAGCGTGTGRILADHLITENDAQQLGQYSAQNPSGSITLNSTATIPNPYPTDQCGGTGPGSGMGTATYGAAYSGLAQNPLPTTNEQCVAQEVADSIFFMSYGYSVSHTFTADVTIPTAAAGSTFNYLYLTTNYEAADIPSTIGGVPVTSLLLGQPTAVAGDPRANNAGAVGTGRDLWLDYLGDHVRASAAGFVNWACDLGNELFNKGIDLTTGAPLDTELSNSLTSWGFVRISCDGGTGAFGARGSTYTPAITQAVPDPGPFNNE